MTVASDYTSITVGDYVGLGSSSKTGVTDSIDTTIVAIPASIPSLSISRPIYTDITATYAGLPSSTSSSKGATLTFSWT